MMQKDPIDAPVFNLIPVFSSKAGSCLTIENWQEVGIRAASYYLSDLLMKPGFDFLMTLPDLATYVGWHDLLILNASSLPVDVTGSFKIKSCYDGSVRQYKVDELLAVIRQLKPHIVIFPTGIDYKNLVITDAIPESIFPFFPVDELSNIGNSSYGAYFCYNKMQSSTTELLQQISQHQGRECYISGDLSPELLRLLTKAGVRYLETDAAAHEACLGILYNQSGNIAIQDTAQSMQFMPIEPNCNCPTCKQQLTRAYLHHLFAHTPLLCQRFLIQHNVYHNN